MIVNNLQKTQKNAKKIKIVNSNKKINQKINPLYNPIIIGLILLYLLIIGIYLFDSSKNFNFYSNFFNKNLSSNFTDNSKLKIKTIETTLENEGQLIAKKTDVTFVVDGNIDKAKLEDFASENYLQIKEQLGLKNDFCIHFEDKDGNVIDISQITQRKGIGIGSPEMEYKLIDKTGAAIGVVNC